MTELGPRASVRCDCRHEIFDGIVVRARCVRLLPRGGAEALCRCKRWVAVPLTYALPDGVAQVDAGRITLSEPGRRAVLGLR